MGKRVLLVDDTDTVLMAEKMMLSGLGLEIATAKNGAEAIQKAAAARPDLVLLDIQMPVLDGIETCRRFKGNADTSAIPVIMVTTRGEPEKVEQAFSAGCNDFLTKPIDKLELLAKVKRYLG
jgi:CheY-like chemotaxis protein